jgi:sulfate adenylyltransferase
VSAPDAPLPEELQTLPSVVPSTRELGDLELLLAGAYSPLTGFLGQSDVEAVRTSGRLADGTPWPAPITIGVADDVREGGSLVLTDPEGAPLAVLDVEETWPDTDGHRRAAGKLRALRAAEHGTFAGLRRSPGEVRAELSNSPVLARVTAEPLLTGELTRLAARAGDLQAQVLILLAVGDTTATQPPETLIRAVLAARPHLPEGTIIVPVPLSTLDDPDRDLSLRAHVAAAYGATHLHADRDAPAAPLPLLIDPDTTDAHRTLAAALDEGAELPASLVPDEVATELRAARPPRNRRGVVVFFTGLSGSGKSTIARGLHDALLERGGRTVTLLDGDVVRRLLSAGLTFSRADRDLNIRRIGYVAAEVARHGGIALCAPIAPYAATRAEVRARVTEVGDFVLVHVATPLEVCEARDRKGLYAKARAGLLPEFTGISDPYEAPEDADLVLDTSHTSAQDAVGVVLGMLTDRGYLTGRYR